MRDDLVVTLGGRYYAVECPWGRLPGDQVFGPVSQLAVDSHGRVYVFQRSNPPLLVFDRDGTLVDSWGEGEFSDAHGIFITREDLVLLVDRDAHQILACELSGAVRFRLGQRHRPQFNAPFNHPTDIAQAPNGDYYVSDGYGNSQVHCFDADGTFRFSWGRPGDGPGEFTTPHAVWVDPAERVLVADRENNRVQLFDLEGRFLEAWPDFFHPMDIYADSDGNVFVTDQIPRLSMLSPDGALIGRCRPVRFGAHGVGGDADGNLYLAETAPLDCISRLRLL
ncbi:MAG: peptidyl-alpha-hydroxyglycine alpha-amidating lyase family protein [Pseudomonadota bacterium]|nr:peptidyl-alpha-hydroxyglycine alpha-amidating lyase family protein [Pseudomonadota bacterium]